MMQNDLSIMHLSIRFGKSTIGSTTKNQKIKSSRDGSATIPIGWPIGYWQHKEIKQGHWIRLEHQLSTGWRQGVISRYHTHNLGNIALFGCGIYNQRAGEAADYTYYATGSYHYRTTAMWRTFRSVRTNVSVSPRGDTPLKEVMLII